MAPSLEACRSALSAFDIHSGRRKTDRKFRPIVSIVIPTLNCADALNKTLAHISRGSWSNVEVVIADGGSTGETIQVIRDHEHLINRWISAKDSGISEAFNRGIALSTGDIVKITNAGDSNSEHYVPRVVDLFQSNPQAGFVYGDVLMTDDRGSVTRRVKGVENLQQRYFDSMVVAPHPSMAVFMKTYEKVGLFSENLKLSMDFEWLVRCLRAGFTGAYCKSLISLMEEGGESNRLAVHRDWENLKITVSLGTMPAPLAVGRFGLKSAMNLTRLSLESLGQEALSYRFRQSIDRLLGR